MMQSTAISNFVATGSILPISELLAHIEDFPYRWPFPRGDIYHWIPLLNRFDNILEQFTAEYGLQDGPQKRPFGRILLEKGVAQENKAAVVQGTSQEKLDALGYEQDGDRRLIEAILVFSRLLLENCGNRSLYNSSDRISDLLNTTNLSLLSTALRLAVRLAQRYHASRQRGANASQHLNTALLASHYSIDLEKVQKLAAPFTKPSAPPSANSISSGATPSTKGKEKAATVQAKAIPSSDLTAIAKDDSTHVNGYASHTGATEQRTDKKIKWEEWGRVTLSYYQPPPAPKEDMVPVATFPPTPNTPSPTPHRPSGLSRQSRISSFDDSSDSPASLTATKPDEPNVGGMKSLDIPYSRIMSSSAEDILSSTIADIPRESHYELLTKVRIAQGLTGSASTRQRILGIRLLAITNLAYIYPESIFQQKISQQDSDEPRRLQLAYKLADLIHAHTNAQNGVPRWLQTIALGTMEALAKHKAKAADVCAALNVNVSHGVLMHVLRKAVSEMATDEPELDTFESDDWREALFSLLDTLPTSAPRTGESMIAAGLLEILVDILNLRTSKAERSFPKILTFLNTTIYTVRDAFQTFANLKGLDAISDLIAHEVQCGVDAAREQQGMASEFKTKVIDYQVPYFQQQTLRWLFKFVNHMMSHGSGNFDRLLRNLIDSPQLLSGLKTVITNAPIFGSNVWSGAVNIMSAFIHNEPTSFAVIAEAGLSKGLLEAITSRTFPENKAPTTGTESGASEPSAETSHRPPRLMFNQHAMQTDVASLLANSQIHAHSDEDFWKGDIQERLRPANFQSMLTRPIGTVLAKGILPATDAIVTIPQAFGAICLNGAGMDLFIRSNALTTFFEIFESPDHVKSMDNESELARLLGSSFDELVRHHPQLKQLVMLSVLSMVIRVGYLCNPKLPHPAEAAKPSSDADHAEPSSSEGDVEMGEADGTSMNAEVEAEDASTDEDSERGSKVASFINVAMKFLSGFFENPALCSNFAELGGLEFVLDFATSEYLKYDFGRGSASQEIAKVVHMLAEQKPHLVLPSLVHRTQSAVDTLTTFSDHNDGSAYFGRFTTPGLEIDQESAEVVSTIVKSLTSVHSLCAVLYETFSGPVFNSRTSHTVFNQVNLADKYAVLVKSLSRLHRACVWEEILLQKNMPDDWKDATRIKGYGMGSEEADDVFGFIHHDDSPSEVQDNITDNVESSSGNASGGVKQGEKAALAEAKKTPQFQNVKTLRYLLSQIPSSIVPFFQGLGKALVAKRRPDAYARQNAYSVAIAMAEATLEQITFEAPRKTSCAKDRYAYWIVILTSISQLMIEPPLERNHPQCLTLLLQTFKGCGGLNAIKEVLDIFLDEARSFSSDGSNAKDPVDGPARLTSAYGGIKIILNFYSQIVATKPIMESSQTSAIASSDRERGHPHFFSPAQILVEMRKAILPVVRSMWASEFVDKASASIIKCIIDILRTILDGDEEQGALRKGDKPPTRTSIPAKKYNIHGDKVGTLATQGYTVEEAREALYRCMNVSSAAEEYCRAQKGSARVVAHPIPPFDREPPRPTTPAQTPARASSEATVPDSSSATQSDGGEDTPGLPSAEQLLPLVNAAEASRAGNGETTMSTSTAPTPASVITASSADTAGDPMAMSIDNVLNFPEQSASRQSFSSSQRMIESPKILETATIDELDEERAVVRLNLIDRALNLLNVHDDVTFELSDLINSASTKAEDPRAMRKEAGETLIQSLISFQMSDDFRSSGKQVAASANLLALILQDQAFYEATLDDLKENFSHLLGFIKMFPDQPQDETSPWIGQILLVLEKILAEDVQPSQIQWTAPSIDEGNVEPSVVTMADPLLALEDKQHLFNAIVEILPRINKDESLALSVVRTLVILTRNRSIASQLGEKPNIQRLFVMIKQLAGITSDRLQSSFMLLLRHIVEDDDTIRQIMRSEILANFETRRAGTTDTTGYVRQMYHLALRSPEIFVEITNEKVEVKNYDPSHQPQNLVLKPEPIVADPPKDVQAPSEDPEKDAESSKAREIKDTAQPSTEEASTIAAPKSKASETKAPVVQHPSGVIHYLLCELLTYKEVMDKDQVPATKSSPSSQHNLPDPGSDVEMEDTVTPTLALPQQPAESNNNKKEKLEFKPEQHPIYIYRCFLLQCLTELLRCYNRTKIEFINFSRRADGKATTPSKPRSSVLNYLLTDLIPVGTLNHEETVAFRKRASTSNWAMSTIVSLCLRTDENGHAKKRGSLEEEDDLDLQFVRRFVLEHALKAYKDANTSDEPLDVKYARLLCLADLFNRLLMGKVVQNSLSPQASELHAVPQRLIAKIMYGKDFIAALTGSIADIDLNFPGSKRAVKYILRPLKQLTQIALVVSATSDDSTTPGQTDDDEISTASSVSDMVDDREETPDLFRNTTLGMFEPGREEESSSDSSDDDEDMYDEEYDEGMEYDEEMERDGDEVVSDEDEEIEGVGPMEGMPGDAAMNVEVVMEEEDMEEESDEDGEDSEDEMDEDEELEVMDEITGDDENDSLADGDEEAWQDEEQEDRYMEGHGADPGMDPNDPESYRNIAREFAEEFADAPAALRDIAMEMEADLAEEQGQDDEDAEEDEEDEEEGEDVIYQPEYDDDDSGIPDPPWGWAEGDDHLAATLPRRHHHHHHSHRVPSPWQIFPNIGGGPEDRMPIYRSTRGLNGSRTADDGTNPLLQRHDRATGGSRSVHTEMSNVAANLSDYWVHGMEPIQPRGMMDSPVSLISNIIGAIGQGGAGGFAVGGPGGSLHFTVGSTRGGIPREVQAVLGLRQPPHEVGRMAGRDDSTQSAAFTPASTPQRWQEEARLLYGNAHAEKAVRIVNSILRLLVPPAIEKERKRREDEAKAIQQAKEAADKRIEEDRLAKEAAEKEAREKREKEEADAAVEAEAAAQRQAQEAQDQPEGQDAGAMEGVEATGTDEPANTSGVNENAMPTEEAAPGPSEPAERVVTTIRGRELDITGMGIDLEYLDALPEELREEVLMSQVALQRSEAAAAGQEPTDISREFLEALPPDIREELLQQEAQDRRRREREENRRRAAESGTGPPAARAEDMDTASFLASLDPTLRQAVLMEQDEEMLAQLPQAIAAEARALGGERFAHRFGDMHGQLNRMRGIERPTRVSPPATQKPQRRQVRQMLNKGGVPTLLRLMFIQQQGSSRSTLNGILHDISQNKQNRAEVISLLLSILQDGTADVNAVERSFTTLSLRAKQPTEPKTPQGVKRSLTNQISPLNNSEMTPLMVVQQCLAALVSLAQYNPSIPFFFLTEHEVSSVNKSKSSRKGKAKENKASKYALNALLSLLDRKLIMESSSCMEQLSSLLQIVTHPLVMLLRKEKDKPEEAEEAEKAIEAPASTENQGNATAPEEPVNAVQGEVANTPVGEPQADRGIPSSALENPPTTTGAEEAEAKPSEADKAAEEKAKKTRNLAPPVVPEETLRLVVNIIAARECSGKTFRDTLSTINNLSAIPGAKEVFGRALIEKAKELGQSILHDLNDLVPQIQKADSGSDIQGMALANFSPASSDQAKLLRVLTALDYLFDPKRNEGKTQPVAADKTENGEPSISKEDMLTTLYEHPTFGALWARLSECLSAIRQGDGTLSIATILLPLIEALMVVCKNTTIKDAPLVKAAKDFSITSPPPESRIETLFFRFTEDHRKILNDLVRHNPKLMSANFSLLVKNPKVLEFDNKRSYFTRRLHSRGTEARHPQPPLSLNVRRDHVFMDSFPKLFYKSADEIKYGKINVRFTGEEGVDAGGVSREWFQVLSRQMFNPDYALFIPVASDRTTFHPNKLSKVNDEHLRFFKFIGRMIGKALYEGRALDCHFSRAVYKRILGKTVSIKDMETLDLDYYKSLIWMLENDITDIITETFSLETDDFGVRQVVDLKPNGRQIAVTEDNKQEYVQLVVEYRLTGSVQEQLEQFLIGRCTSLRTVPFSILTSFRLP